MLHRSVAFQFQALFTSLLRALFSFPSRYYCAIGLKTYLVLEVDDSQVPARIPTHGTQETSRSPSGLRLRDCHTLWSVVPDKFGFACEGCIVGLFLQHHIPADFSSAGSV